MKHIYRGMLVLTIILLAACAEPQEQEKPQPEPTTTTHVLEEREHDPIEDIDKVRLKTVPQSWDQDPEPDGIRIYPQLLDNKGQQIKFEDRELNVDVEIWTGLYDQNNDWGEHRSVYEGTHKINTWKAALPGTNYGITVPYDKINTYSDDGRIGFVKVKVYTPYDLFEAEDQHARIKP